MVVVSVLLSVLITETLSFSINVTYAGLPVGWNAMSRGLLFSTPTGMVASSTVFVPVLITETLFLDPRCATKACVPDGLKVTPCCSSPTGSLVSTVLVFASMTVT